MDLEQSRFEGFVIEAANVGLVRHTNNIVTIVNKVADMAASRAKTVDSYSAECSSVDTEVVVGISSCIKRWEYLEHTHSIFYKEVLLAKWVKHGPGGIPSFSCTWH